MKDKRKDKFYKLVLIFLVGSLVGFLYEEIFYLITDHKLYYQGFLYGPYLPIYGWGSLLLLSLKKFKKNPVLVFLFAILITGVLEYFSGYFMFKIFNKRWWDYTGLFLNIDGYVCLRSVLTFSIGAIILIYWLEPIISNFCIKNKFSKKVAISFLVIYLIDNILTFTLRY